MVPVKTQESLSQVDLVRRRTSWMNGWDIRGARVKVVSGETKIWVIFAPLNRSEEGEQMNCH